MMPRRAGFIRPEAMAELRRWREALCGAALGLVGLWWVLGPGGLMILPGGVLAAAGGALLWIGVQRGRFRVGTGGLGTVQIDEGQIAYFGPLSGGTLAVQDLTRIILDRSGHPGHWRLEQAQAPAVMVPVTADGAEGLFDVFAQLPGLSLEGMLAALHDPQGGNKVIWSKAPRAGLQEISRAKH